MSAQHTSLKRLVSLFKDLEEAYIESLDDLELDLGLSEDTFCSGWVCMLFMMSLPNKLESHSKINWDDVYDKTVAYIKLYLLIDHFMDSSETSDKDKIEMIKWLLDENRVACNEFHEKILAPFNLLTQTSEAKDHMRKLIKVTIEGIKLQKNKNASYKDYFDTSISKGGYTVLVGARLIYGNIIDELSDDDLLFLGGATQLFDDMVDTTEDLNEGIHTICTYTLDKKGNVDKIAKELICMLKKLPPHFSHYATSMNLAVKYHVIKSSHYSYAFKSKLLSGFILPKDNIFPYKRREEKKFRKLYTSRRCITCGGETK